MYEKQLKELQAISHAAGARPDYCQGGGGNTSIKLDDEWMAIKASGFRLTEVTSSEGFAVVNYKKALAFLEANLAGAQPELEKESSEQIRNSCMVLPGTKALRPSVEAGFHSVLGRTVIHSHSVYANILCCSKQGKKLAESISNKAGISSIWVPYLKPGFFLSRLIDHEIGVFRNKTGAKALSGKIPEAIFMANHGLVITSNDPVQCVSIHDELNSMIMGRLGVALFPKVELSHRDGELVSGTPFVRDFILRNRVSEAYFAGLPLYPDQIVYLNEYAGNKFTIVSNNVVYNTDEKEALAIEESLVAYFYIIDQIKKARLEIVTMAADETDFIKNWESEKYRRQVAAGDKKTNTNKNK
ncbi:MAG: class II aldolase [Spirochaetaceae bacterium]|nr:MAG: class II aldolase [Spirochaetaceae bacterium]